MTPFKAGFRLTVATVLLSGFASSVEAVVLIDWVQVGAPGNVCDTQIQGCFGAVAHRYAISKYEVTHSQYAEFLNAVAGDDPNGLYNVNLAGPTGGITRSGSSGSYTYATVAGREDKPVDNVSWYDAARFVNWLQNGQPAGAQGPGTTETGAYTLTGPTSISGARAPAASIFLPTEDEWYKAAYYDPALSVYYDYPAGFDAQTVCATPTPSANRANCDLVVGDKTDVGAYTGSPSPFGTFDQAGNVREWTETSEPTQIIRGGSWSADGRTQRRTGPEALR